MLTQFPFLPFLNSTLWDLLSIREGKNMTVRANTTFTVSGYIKDVVYDVYDSRAIHLHHIIYQEPYILRDFKNIPRWDIFKTLKWP